MPHTDLPYTYEPMHEYPDMRPADEAIWSRFIEQNPDRFFRVYYDFRVGDAAEHDTTLPANVRASWADLTKWAIDVVAEDEDAIFVIEVKPFANAKAIGQALAYAHLYEAENAPKKPVYPVVLTDTIISTTQRVADHLGVVLWRA